MRHLKKRAVLTVIELHVVLFYTSTRAIVETQTDNALGLEELLP
jgi:hypothetical protein